MLNIIYTSLGLAIAILAVNYIILISALAIKKKYSNVASIKVRIVLTSILCALSIIKIILAIILGKSIGSEIFFCAIPWAICTVIGFWSLINSRFKENEDVDFTEEQDIDER